MTGPSRRELLTRFGMGMGTIGLATILDAAPSASPLEPRKPPLEAKAKRIIHIFMNGGPSQVDTFDPKPALQRYGGKPIPIHLRTERRTGAGFPSPFEFKRCGASGIEVSEIFPHIGSSIDDICVIRSMHTNIPNHGPSLMMMNCGTERQVRPSFGSWVTYGLGTENQNLPGFVVLCPGGLPTAGSQNWRSAFLPGALQATHVDTKETEVDRLIANVKSHTTPRADQRAQLDLLGELNRRHRESRPEDAMFDARIQSFELAYRMQMEAADVFDVSREPATVREMYGDTLHGRQMLIARRLLEKGVRFVQVWHGAGQPWDSHSEIQKNHARLAGECDRPIGAFLRDLKERGMLDDTLVVWGGEFGRTPTVELTAFGSNLGVNGRDHNSYGFSMWAAGGGIKRGHVHGATDEFGFRAEEKRVHVHDLHATLLRLLGFDHERLTFRYAGRDFRLTDVHGSVVNEILA
ncbi:MAG: DUF1501 domain-containing protein [Acidobacteria bacterium]|nr:DUF1501 domain-containing protein [Acidobacteriota bacterium]